MKRMIPSLFVASFAVLTANAQMAKGNFESKLSKVDAAVPTRTVVSMGKKTGNFELTAPTIKKFNAKGTAVTAMSDLTVFYAIPYGAWIEGVEPGKGWYSVPRVYTPAFREQVWENYTYSSNETTPITYNWADQGDYTKYELAENGADGIGAVWGSVYTPTLTAIQGADVASYNFGMNGSEKMGIWTGGTDEYLNLGIANFGNGSGPWTGFSNLDLYTNTKGDVFELDRNGNRIAKSGEYFSSNIVGFAQRFTGMNDFVTAISAAITLAVDDNSNPKPLNGKTLTCTVYELTEDGFGETLMTATATDENVVQLGDWLYTIEFPFVENDPLFGTIESPLYLNGQDVMVVFTGFEEVAMPMYAPFCDNGGLIAGGYFMLADGTLSTLPYQGTNYPQIDHLVTLKAAIPALEPGESMPKQLYIPAEGGPAVTAIEDGKEYNDFDVYTSNPNIEDFYVYTDDDSDWLQMSYDDSYVENYGVMIFYFGAEALPAGVESRQCVLIIDYMGKTIELPVFQGATAGIGSVATDSKKSSFVYNLAGQKVNKNFKGVTIHNGKKYIQK